MRFQADIDGGPTASRSQPLDQLLGAGTTVLATGKPGELNSTATAFFGQPDFGAAEAPNIPSFLLQYSRRLLPYFTAFCVLGRRTMVSFLSLREKIFARLASLGAAGRIVLLFGLLIVATVLVFWVFNQIFFYFAAKTYVDEISQAYNLNRGFTNALVWAAFALFVFFAGCAFSLSKTRRTLGYTGALVLLIGHGVLLGLRDANYDTAGNALKCYVLTRDGIKVLNHVGTDPDTGRECKLLTPQMVEKYNAYRNGRRPLLVTENDPVFFDPVSGEPVIWFSKTSGHVDLFDLMGFDPRTGEELKPVDRATIEQWRSQSAKMVRRAPNRISDPEKFGFFDPVSGKPKVWYWTSAAGQYEFYDGPGFHQKFGDELKLITPQAIDDWRKGVEEKRKAEERKAQEERDRLAKEAAEQKAAAEAKAAAVKQAAEAKAAADKQAQEDLERQQQAGIDCDRLAANPTDARRGTDSVGVGFDALKFRAQAAFDACQAAVKQATSELRYQYQLGRAAQFVDKKKAFELFTSLTKAGYAAAFDNLGGMYQDKNDIGAATKLFQAGVAAGDADSMLSLAYLIGKGYYTPPNAVGERLALLQRSAQLGNQQAQIAFQEDMQKLQAANQEAAAKAEMQRQMIDLFGAVVQNAIRR